MILIPIILGLVVFFVFAVIPLGKLHNLWAALGLLVSVGAGGLTMATVHSHYGMEKTTTTKTISIKPTSSSKGLSFLIYKQLGTGSEKIYVYKTAKNKQTHTQANANTTNTVKTNSSATSGKLVVKETRYKFKSKLMKALFGVFGDTKQVIARTNTFEIPSSWEAMSTTQATKFKKLMAANKAKLKQAIQAEVKAGLVAAMTKNPTMSKAEQAKLTKQLAAKAQAAQIKKYLTQAKQ